MVSTSKPYSVLITDDDRGCREALREIMEPEGFQTRLASSGEEALDIVRDEPIHLAFLDMNMPTLSGLETLELRVRRQTESASELAKRLEAHSSVQVVRYPGIGGLLSFDVAGADEARHVETTLRVIRNATSLGGVHSLLEARARWEGHRVPPGLLRLSVGLEPVEDLWADLAQALEFPSDSRARE